MLDEKKKPYILVCDFHQGVYFGKLEKLRDKGRTVDLSEARHCFYFSQQKAGHRGVYGLATKGPASGSSIGPVVSMRIYDVANITICSKDAVKQWKKQRW